MSLPSLNLKFFLKARFARRFAQWRFARRDLTSRHLLLCGRHHPLMDPARVGAAARPFMSSRGAHAHPQVRTARRGEKLMRLKNAARGRAVGREGRPGCPALAPDTAPTAAALADGRRGR